MLAALVADEPADRACRAALADGAHYKAGSSRLAPLDELITIYDRRLRHLATRGHSTLGEETLIARLRASESSSVRVESVHGRDFNFIVFLAPRKPHVVACFGVTTEAANPNWSWDGEDSSPSR